MQTRRVAIFANSIKHGQYCVAGKCLKTKEWVRPVGSRNGKELSKQQVLVSNRYGSFPVKPMQKVDMCLASHAPLINQPENYLVSNESQWVQHYRLSPSELAEFLDHPQDLWGTGNCISYGDIVKGAVQIRQSLYLVKVDQLSLFVNSFNKRRARFSYNGVEYLLPVTDRRFGALRNGDSTVQGVLCISLAEEFKGNCYKIVANIL